ncbi:NAD-dependent epimerase/dehydratase family protein [Thermoproteota archaeon]
MVKDKVLLTGASGSMGNAAFLELLKRKNKYNMVLLLRPSKKNRKYFSRFFRTKSSVTTKQRVNEYNGLKIVWGDLTNPDDVRRAVDGCNFVLHPAALISPVADHNPKMAKKVNLVGTKNIIVAIKSQPNNGDNTKLVYVGSVAEYGDRLAPVYRIRVGDPLIPSFYDFYATTKIAAERAVIESDLKYWVSIRQTYIGIPKTLTLLDPIMFHQPLEQRVELITDKDAGYGLVQCLEAPEEFWGNIYNMSGGPSCRFIYQDYLKNMMKLLGIGDYRKIMDKNWFCLRNFHGGWFKDSYILNDFLHHWRNNLEDHYKQVKENKNWYSYLARIIPKYFVKKLMKKMATEKTGPLHWIESNNEGRINAFFGSKKKWESIHDWKSDSTEVNIDAYLLNHGFDEKKPENELNIEDMKDAARFRGGECLSQRVIDMNKKLKWKCAFGHHFEGSPTLILKGGHWCPDCEAPPWDYDKIAAKNPFFAQVYYANHAKDENNYYGEKSYEDIL